MRCDWALVRMFRDALELQSLGRQCWVEPVRRLVYSKFSSVSAATANVFARASNESTDCELIVVTTPIELALEVQLPAPAGHMSCDT